VDFVKFLISEQNKNTLSLNEWAPSDEFAVDRNVSIGPTRRGRARVRQSGRRAGPGGPRARRRRRGGTTALRGPTAAGTGADRERRLRASAGGRHSSPSSRIAPGRFGDRGGRSLSRGHRNRPARLPDPKPSALAKLAEVAELEKGGTAWENEPRIPAGQSDGGQWTTAAGAPAVGAEHAAHISPRAPPSSEKPPLPLDDGVYRPGIDAPHVILTAGEEDEAESRRSNGPPDDFTRLEDVFPGLRDAPSLAIPLAPIDGFLGISAGIDATDVAITWDFSRALVWEIKQVDPSFVDVELLPMSGIAGLTWQGRTNLINNLLMQRAAAYYRMRGDVGRLQVETLRFLQNAVDAAYEEAVSAADAGRLQPRLSREEAIGNRVDFEVRGELRDLFASFGIPYGPGADVTINNRDYETSEDDESYRIPDARLRDVSIDWTLVPKTISTPQIRGFFRADSQPRAVVIIRPSQLGPDSTYLIPRPSDVLLWR